MINFKSYGFYLSKCFSLIKHMHKETGLSKSYLFLDFLWCYLRHGCLLKQYYVGNFYKKKEFERRGMLTYRRVFDIIGRYNDKKYIHFLDNKVDFNMYFSDFIHRKWTYSKKMDYQTFSTVAHSSTAIIIKPINDWEGHGIYKVETKSLSEQELKVLFEQLKKENVLIEECIVQHPNMVFQNESVNTIRIYTFFNPKSSKYVLLKPLLRVGVGNTVVDNYCSGGCVYELDSKEGVIITRSLSKVNPNALFHPGTDICMLGYIIPRWKDVITMCEKAARHIPECQFVGWDIAILQNGDIEFIEGNHNPDYELLEFIGETGHYKKIKDCIN